jgi:hypothetical protein
LRPVRQVETVRIEGIIGKSVDHAVVAPSQAEMWSARRLMKMF